MRKFKERGLLASLKLEQAWTGYQTLGIFTNRDSWETFYGSGHSLVDFFLLLNIQIMSKTQRRILGKSKDKQINREEKQQK